MEQIASIEAIARVIQLSVAPVFLLAGIAGLLNVLSTRLGRIIDRARVVENRIPQAQTEPQRQTLHAEILVLWARMRLTGWAIRLCVSGALLICLLIVALFVGDFVTFNISVAIAALFVAAMLLIVAGLVCLLRETGISAHSIRQGMELALQGIGQDQPRGRA
jgi:hypothetical protein